MSTLRPIIVVTGANSGVGFGICHRLLLQLSQKIPPDAQPQFKSLSSSTDLSDSAPETYDGLTLILACRSEQKALEARTKLFRLLDQHITKLKQRPDYDGHAEQFRKNLKINFHRVDMSVVQSVMDFGDELSQSYPYISHLICNAGCGFWSGVDKLLAFRIIFTKGLNLAVTLPSYKLQKIGIMSKDGLGATWQSNLFGHYIMYRRLKPLFKAHAQRAARPARVIWTSSVEGQPCWYNHADWQLVKTDHSYEASKYQIDLVAAKLEQRCRESGGEGDVVRHFIVHPGIAHSNMTKDMIWFVLDVCKIALFWIARWLGSPNHTIDGVTAAASATHITLVCLTAIPTALLAWSRVHSTPHTSLCEDGLSTMGMYDGGLESAQNAKAADLSGRYVPIKFGAQTDRRGRDFVGVMPVLKWEEHENEAEFLLDKCESLYDSFSALHTPSSKNNANGKLTNGHVVNRPTP